MRKQYRRRLLTVAITGLALNAASMGLGPVAATAAGTAPCASVGEYTNYWCGYTVARTTLPRNKKGPIWSRGTYARDISSAPRPQDRRRQ